MTSMRDAIATARAFAAEAYPSADLVFLCGSWATKSAHADSDLDLVIVDDTAERVSFEGTMFNGFVVEACVLPSNVAETFFRDSAKFRSAPVPSQVARGLLVLGAEVAAEPLRQSAMDVLDAGPMPISLEEKNELLYELSSLLIDLKHAKPEMLTAISAFAHVALSKAVLDLNRAWRADRKSLRKAVAALDPEFADDLDGAMADACGGSRLPMIRLCERVLDSLHGPKRTYPKFSV